MKVFVSVQDSGRRLEFRTVAVTDGSGENAGFALHVDVSELDGVPCGLMPDRCPLVVDKVWREHGRGGGAGRSPLG